jgi:hypothetical protein
LLPLLLLLLDGQEWVLLLVLLLAHGAWMLPQLLLLLLSIPASLGSSSCPMPAGGGLQHHLDMPPK